MDIFSVLIETFIITVFVDFWNSQFLSENRLFARRQEKALFCFLMALCAAGVLLALLRWSAADVRSESGEVIFYFVFSLAGIVAVHYVFAFFGISLRDDAIERRNRAALCAVSGLTTALPVALRARTQEMGPVVRSSFSARPFPLAPFSYSGCY
jgi:hypothetical protein